MRILRALLEISAYATVLFAVTWLMRRLMRNRLSPAMRYAMWSLFILRLLLPVTLQSPVRLFTLPEAAPPAVSTLSEPAGAPSPAAGAARVGVAAAQATQSMETEARAVPDASAPAGAAKAAASEPSVEGILLAVWLTGVFAGLMYLAALYALLRRRVAKNAVRPSSRLCALYRGVRRELRVRANVPLVCQCRLEDFSQETVDRLVQYLTGGAPLYVWPKVKDKADYALEIADAEKGALIDDEYVVTSDSRRVVAELRALQAAAPDRVARAYTDATLDYGYDTDGTRDTEEKCVVSVGVDYGGEDAAIVVSNGVVRGRAYTWMYYAKGHLLDAETLGMNGDPLDPNPRYAGWLALIDTLNVDAATAEAQAWQALAALGIEDMALIGAEDCILASWDNEGGLSARAGDAAARLVSFAPKTAVGTVRPLPYPYAYAGRRTALPGERGAAPDGAAYAPRNVGLVQIAVGDAGIEYFQWQMPAETDIAVAACGALMPFAEVQSRVTELLTTVILPDEIPALPNAGFFANIRVRDMELIHYPAFDGDSIESYAVTPVWRVTYRTALDAVYGDGRKTRKGDAERRPSLLINAVNGALLVTK